MRKIYKDINVASQNNQKGGLVALIECDFLRQSAEGKVCLELGSYTGMSTVSLAETAKEVITIDTFKANSAGQTQMVDFTTLDMFKENICGYDNIFYHIGRTSEIVPTLNDGYFDLVFIDAMHDVKSVEADLLMVWSKLKMGGMMIFHDYGWDAFYHDGGPKAVVDKYFDEFIGSVNSIVCVLKKSEIIEPLTGKENSLKPTVDLSIQNIVGRYMCLGCGRFWEVERSMVGEWGSFHCPYCWDVYTTDNIIPEKPLSLFPPTTIHSCCGDIISDTPTDLRFCVCGKQLDAELPKNMSIIDWQKSELERIGI
jgi:predicted O-methyltransferase YrrM